MGTTSGPSLRGELHVYPFGETERTDVVTQQYQDLLEEYEGESILCLTRLCSEQELTDSIVTSVDEVGYPNISTLTTLATDTLQAFIPRLTKLSDHERIELLAAFLDEYDWDTEYLASASQQESFQQDVGELLIEMESRDALDPDAYDSPILQEIATVGTEFQAQLVERQYVDRPSLIPRAITTLEEATANHTVPQSLKQWDAVLVADFEEFAETERQFLAAITDAADAALVSVAERDSRVLSSWREPGTVDSLAASMSVTTHTTDRETVSATDAVGEYLTTNTRPAGAVDAGSVQVIETATFRDQLTAVADEIERLCRTEDYTYADITIAYQDSGGPIEQTIRLLRRHGIPTTTVAMTQLGNDPAVKELHDLTKVCTASVDEEEKSVSRERLLAQEEATTTLLEELEDADTAITGLWHWIQMTQLKDRIASDWTDLEARDQFQRVQDVIRLAEFLADEDDLDGTWDGFLPALERAFRYSSTRLEDIESEHDDGGVPVGTIYGLKHTTSKAVFLLNVTDEDYPFTPDLTALLPSQRIQQEPQFPMLTTRTPTDVTNTFRPAVDPPDDPFRAYFTQVSRRLLGVGAHAAAERLYMGVPGESADSLGTYLQQSRFLTELVETFQFIEPLNEDRDTPTASHGGASEYVVEHVDETLEAVRRASVGGETVDLDAYERELAAIDELLDHPTAATVQDALSARIDFRHGRVKRD